MSEILEQIEFNNPEKTVTYFQDKRDDHPEIETIESQLDPSKHKVFDVVFRKKKRVKADEGEEVVGVKTVTRGGKTSEVQLKEIDVVRIGIGYQELIVKRAVAFAFGNPVEYNADVEENSKEEEVFNAVKSILNQSKDFALNREFARELFSFKEVAELWYPIETESHTSYGIETKFKLKRMLLQPSKGEKLYPLFDEFNDMIAFSREFKIKRDKKDVEVFETYTADQIYRYEKTDGWKVVEGYPKTNVIGKIPIVFSQQERTEWELVQNIIERDETLRSNFGDTNDYHADPKIFVKGKINGWASKGQSGQVIEGGENSSAQYLSWNNAPQSVQQEHNMNREDIFTLTQTPDTSFYNMKGIGNLSGVAQKMMFFDAHLKVKEKEGMLLEHLQRRVNIIKAFVSTMNVSYKTEAENLIIDPEITPYMIGDETENNMNISTAVSGGFMSQLEAIRRAGYVDNANEELEQIQNEFKQAQEINLFEPTNVE